MYTYVTSRERERVCKDASVCMREYKCVCVLKRERVCKDGSVCVFLFVREIERVRANLMGDKNENSSVVTFQLGVANIHLLPL